MVAMRRAVPYIGSMKQSLNYEQIVEQNLLGVVRDVLDIVAGQGQLPGDHYFYITFRTGAPNVRLSQWLKEKYPDRMTIVLQHQFSDLEVAGDSFSVSLDFNGTERLTVPFSSITSFVDQHVNFVMYFNGGDEDGDGDDDESPLPVIKKAAKKSRDNVIHISSLKKKDD